MPPQTARLVRLLHAAATPDAELLAQFRDSGGRLLGFALTGAAIKDKTTLQKELPAIMA